MEKASVIDIFFESLELSLSHRALWLFGCILALPNVILFTIMERYELRTSASLQSFATDHLVSTLLFVIVSVSFMLIGKSALILMLEKRKRHARSSDAGVLPSRFNAFLKALRIDLALLLFFVLIVSILALPLLLSAGTEGSASDTLLLLAEFTLLPIIFITYIIREFTYYYFLLSPLTLKSAFEASIQLFSRHKQNCLHFGFLFLLFGLLFTFLLNLVMLSIVTLLPPTGSSIDIVFFIIPLLIGITWYEVFKQVFSFEFFQTLARPKSPLPRESVPQILKEEAEIPGV